MKKGDMEMLGRVTTPEGAEFIVLFGDNLKTTLAMAGKIKSVSHIINGDTADVSVTYENRGPEKFPCETLVLTTSFQS